MSLVYLSNILADLYIIFTHTRNVQLFQHIYILILIINNLNINVSVNDYQLPFYIL